MIIGLVGKKGVGKDTTADFLVKRFGFKKLAFATPLKRVCEALYNIEPKYFYDPALKEEIIPFWGVSPRQMMQNIGTNVVREHLGDDFWLKHMENALSDQHTNVVISDVRFISEALFVKMRGGIIIRVIRQNENENNDTGTDTHVSEVEQELISHDFAVTNHGNVESNLYKQIDQLISQHHLV